MANPGRSSTATSTMTVQGFPGCALALTKAISPSTPDYSRHQANEKRRDCGRFTHRCAH